jgi:hypothetical protein
LEFSFILALNESSSGGPASVNDASAYATTIDAQESPVFADGGGALIGATPFTGNTRPELCALTPDMEILACTTGHGAYQGLLNQIKTHAGL